ncbi:hypothetical protein LJC61_02660 [Ruminococcaceae bacterium OttesenSCG-928-A16]|nr:hypothetical protein [Ruminococcaceae bacterium OttesenSCG-928-A16]
MQKPHRQVRTSKAKTKAFSGRCQKCGKEICLSCACQYTDESNAAISANSPWLCATCYNEQHGKGIEPIDRLKSSIISKAVEYGGKIDLNHPAVLATLIDLAIGN